MYIHISGQHITNLKAVIVNWAQTKGWFDSTHNNYGFASYSQTFELVSSPDVLLPAWQLVSPHIRWHNCCLGQEPPIRGFALHNGQRLRAYKVSSWGIHSQDWSGSLADKSKHCMGNRISIRICIFKLLPAATAFPLYYHKIQFAYCSSLLLFCKFCSIDSTKKCRNTDPWDTSTLRLLLHSEIFPKRLTWILNNFVHHSSLCQQFYAIFLYK